MATLEDGLDIENGKWTEVVSTGKIQNRSTDAMYFLEAAASPGNAAAKNAAAYSTEVLPGRTYEFIKNIDNLYITKVSGTGKSKASFNG